jgi:hypothetical protein
MKVLEINHENALSAHKAADDAGKRLLENLLGPDVFKKASGKITDRIKTFEDACAALEEDPDDNQFTDGEPDEIAYRKIKVIARALNEGWKPNWNNSNEYKWYPWFYLNNPGFRFIDTYFDCTYTYTTGGSRLCFKSQDLAKYAGEQFLNLYKDFIA